MLPVLALSALFNYGWSFLIINSDSAKKKRLMLAGVAVNLGVLLVFKYTNFFIDNLNLLTDSNIEFFQIVLPIGISFFTFQQIAYLIAVRNDMRPPESFTEYLLFVSCFAYITAGPIVGAREILAQRDEIGRIDLDGLLAAITLFSIGLFKKLVLAASFSPYSGQMFDAAQRGEHVNVWDAWLGAWSYFLQLYFDFGGYSDMAMALALMFGLRIPLNFNSPLKATSAIDYWQRWHITLTKFLTNYLFMPISVAQTRKLMGRKVGRGVRFARTYGMPVMITFLLAGIWHGANWTFVVYGAWWGIVLVINHGWRQLGFPKLPIVPAWILTMLAVLIAMVLFRSADMGTASSILASLVGLGVGAASRLPLIEAGVMIVCAIAACLVMPNVAQILSTWKISLNEVTPATGRFSKFSGWQWRLNRSGLIFTASILLALIFFGGQDTQFLYYQF